MIKLSDIIIALEMTSIEHTYFYNTKTNEILWKNDFDNELSTYQEKDEFNDDIILMFDFFIKNDYDIMQKFIDNIKNIEIRNDLYNITIGKGSFKRFKDALLRYDLLKNWYSFRDNEYKNIAKDWCNKNNIKYEEDC